MYSPLADAPQIRKCCAKCDTEFGLAINAWYKATNSYFFEVQPLQDGITLKPGRDIQPYRGDVPTLLHTHNEPLKCRNCSEIIAFRVVKVESPGRSNMLGNVFHKLSKIKLYTMDNQPVAPDDRYTLQGHEERHPTVRSESKSPLPSSSRSPSVALTDLSPIPPDITEADWAAADRVIRKDAWQDVHIEWEERTSRDLSPAGFGRRILPLVTRRKSQRKSLASSGGSLPASPSVAPAVTMALPVGSPNLHGPVTVSQREASGHVSPLVASNITGVTTVASPLENSTGIVPQRSAPLPERHFELRELRSDIARLEAEARETRSILEDLRAELSARRVSSLTNDPHILELLSNQVGTLTEKVGEFGRLKLDNELLTVRVKRLEEGNAATPSTPSAYAPVPSMPPTTTAAPTLPATSFATRFNEINAVKRKAADALDYEEPRRSLQEEAPTHYIHSPGATPSFKRGRGRPPGSASKQLGRESPHPAVGWQTEYSYIEPTSAQSWRPVNMYPGESPQAQDDSRLVRRTSGGGPVAVPPGTKRYRTKPTRNHEGVLIRKDGRPDRRSVTSAQNLAKHVHSRADASPPTSTPATYGPIPPMTKLEPKIEAKPTVEPPKPTTPQDPHSKIMGKMFPHGPESDREKLTQGARTLGINPSEDTRMRPRSETAREELATVLSQPAKQQAQEAVRDPAPALSGGFQAVNRV